MSDQSDNTIDILLKLGVIGQSDVAAANDLLRQGNAIAAESKNATVKLGEATADGAKAGEKSEISHRALHQVLHLIGRESGPEAAAALSGLAAAGTGNILLLIMAVKELFEWLKKIHEEEKAAADAIQAKWEATREALSDAAQSADDLEAALTKASKPVDAIKSSFEAQNKLLEAQIEDHKKILEALEKEELAAAKGDKQKEDAIRRRFDDLKKNYDLAAEQQKLDQLQLELVTRRGAQFQLNDTAFAARQAVVDAKESPALLAAQNALKDKTGKPLDREALDSDVNRGTAFTDSAKKSLANANEILRQLGSEGRKPGDPEYEQAVALKRDAQKRIDALTDFDKNTEVVRQHTETIRLLNKKSQDADSAAEANTTAITEETAARDTAKSVYDEHAKTAKQESALSAVEKAGGFANSNSIIGGGVRAVDAFQQGQKLTQQQAEQAALFRALFDAVGGNGVTMIGLMKQSLAKHVSQQQEITALQRDFNNLRSRADRPRQ